MSSSAYGAESTWPGTEAPGFGVRAGGAESGDGPGTFESDREGACAVGPSTERDEVIPELLQLLRAYSLESQGLAATYAARQRLHPTDLQILSLCMAAERTGGASTPGGIGKALSLTSGAVTTALDRLETAGHLHRVRDDDDRRRVHVRLAEPGRQVGRDFFGGLAQRSNRELACFDDAELEVIRRFLTAVVSVMAEYRYETTGGGPGR